MIGKRERNNFLYFLGECDIDFGICVVHNTMKELEFHYILELTKDELLLIKLKCTIQKCIRISSIENI